MTMTTTGRPTLAAIAKEANVAVSTVSKVLNGHTDVASSTRKQVERLLADRGFRRPRSARHSARRPDLIDLVINELDSVWGLSILTGVEEVAEPAG
ncbi:LacI family DNA-binding transcriptional regulator [Actinoplanes sp. CA-142083]|uniref:LacI family DNA-binding transcriptional regulator n=1 Tax=Actinoplanes sp. CA-142083 TaxID=3239903 RepID=UPI003D9324C5